ncbi:MAG: hypothetical protein JWN48_1572 [Myxococcaceae bacterium]|nr:hypothetical protein [Myxococcaceae bacterium]
MGCRAACPSEASCTRYLDGAPSPSAPDLIVNRAHTSLRGVSAGRPRVVQTGSLLLTLLASLATDQQASLLQQAAPSTCRRGTPRDGTDDEPLASDRAAHACAARRTHGLQTPRSPEYRLWLDAGRPASQRRTCLRPAASSEAAADAWPTDVVVGLALLDRESARLGCSLRAASDTFDLLLITREHRRRGRGGELQLSGALLLVALSVLLHAELRGLASVQHRARA